MVIDIDIKIANSNGQLIHRFSKRFDEKAETAEKINNAGLSKDFEDFLSEYLSVSGRSIREKLISYPETPLLGQSMEEEEENLYGKDPSVNDYADSEMEYKIRIGKDKVIAGRIPFHRLTRLNTVTDALEREEISDRSMTEPQSISGGAYYQDFGGGTADNPIINRNKDTMGDLEKNLKNLMIQAVEKYESSFYHMGEETT
jgi:hypothetical protein